MTDLEMNEHSAWLGIHDQFFHDHVKEVDGWFHMEQLAPEKLGINCDIMYLRHLWNLYFADFKFNLDFTC